MRIGEINNIIKNAVNENNQIQIKSEALYGGQAYKIENFIEIIQALDIISKQTWNQVDYSEVENLKKGHEEINPQVLTNEEFNSLNAYINAVNPSVPLYALTVESFTEDQDEKTLNIKLPEDVTSLKSLSETNERLSNVLKLFNVDGQFEFKGFDKGTEWYVLVCTGYLSYRFVIACLKIAQEYFRTRTEYFNSEKARIAYETSLEEGSKYNEEGYSKYREKWLRIFIEKEVKKAIDAIGLNGQTPEELNSQLVKATTKLIKELDEGTEFHLSLNPPSYAREENGRLEIDYKKIKASQKENPQKNLEAPQPAEANFESEEGK